ncbi:unnamed protein product [Amoebophrya sp. A120]|nr:unnamed protein product [Amoebophrya sp. A120]|eukprot:GSA120T00022212001.1
MHATALGWLPRALRPACLSAAQAASPQAASPDESETASEADLKELQELGQKNWREAELKTAVEAAERAHVLAEENPRDKRVQEWKQILLDDAKERVRRDWNNREDPAVNIVETGSYAGRVRKISKIWLSESPNHESWNTENSVEKMIHDPRTAPRPRP